MIFFSKLGILGYQIDNCGLKERENVKLEKENQAEYHLWTEYAILHGFRLRYILVNIWFQK